MQFMGSEGIFGEVEKAELGGGRNGRRHRVERGPDVPPGSLLTRAWGLTLFLSKMNIEKVEEPEIKLTTFIES